jgi:hypothetical protein
MVNLVVKKHRLLTCAWTRVSIEYSMLVLKVVTGIRHSAP